MNDKSKTPTKLTRLVYSVLLFAASLSLISASLTGCTTTDLQNAAADQGRAQAGVHLPKQPPTCWSVVPHASLKVGDDPVAGIKRERHQLDVANQQGAGCSTFNKHLAENLAK